ncbi:hypothetical protein [Flavobacterium chungangense]|uniref:Uncharacterized protein n=1 Tax=Flavobacterium chungangense TaxID=554283 RepID=A0A6V6YXD0_9FLAO|nr:hypothetical protein [Flavobacterium chungangense]CAD0004151.1 hypothetical protein FLACHUCJ7_01767 [Flavobacterium chungangense]
MAHLFYSHLVFIPPSSNATIAILKEYLDDFYQRPVIEDKPKIVSDNKRITITFSDGYNFYIHLAKEDYVITEAAEIADYRKTDWNENAFDKEKLKASGKRFEIWGDPDFDMDYFNDSLFILEIIEKFNDVIILENQ